MPVELLVAAQVHDGHPYTPMEVAILFHHTNTTVGTGSIWQETDEALRSASSPSAFHPGNHGGPDVVGRQILLSTMS